MTVDPSVRAAVQEWASQQVRGSFEARRDGWCPKCDKFYPKGRRVAFVKRRLVYPESPASSHRDVLLCEPCAAEVVLR
ncbi:hypothetical protein SEA_CRATER_64 [Gordonia phage Crater]|uniref:Uncharacterized protein n=1 Tax=Gordonia phage Apricot TaxID=2250319 RepID=A0A345L171_9CAUD|nr:hypothetical protein HOT72_gp064 [Gordonia phage Apricot]AXH49023.1 hypothetical protein SEA_APRICOT_64 [Gordonia phage Apricot]QYC53730.1 hypothetical protein SEA_LEROY_64 [Gordonia phage Leroy]WNM69771.1 hypothetical protein SEA_CRATER_64 [Gordonia phage Crater]